jgi:hypothetical protein
MRYTFLASGGEQLVDELVKLRVHSSTRLVATRYCGGSETGVHTLLRRTVAARRICYAVAVQAARKRKRVDMAATVAAKAALPTNSAIKLEVCAGPAKDWHSDDASVLQ